MIPTTQRSIPICYLKKKCNWQWVAIRSSLSYPAICWSGWEYYSLNSHTWFGGYQSPLQLSYLLVQLLTLIRSLLDTRWVWSFCLWLSGCVLHFKECIWKDQGVDVVHLRVCGKFRINVEKYWHIDFFTRKEPLLLKTKALDLVEVNPCLHWCHIVSGNTCDWCFTFVLCCVKSQGTLPRSYTYLTLGRGEFPGHSICNISIKLHHQFSNTCRFFSLVASNFLLHRLHEAISRLWIVPP